MRKFLNSISRYKNILLVGIISSVMTVLVASGVLYGLVSNGVISLDSGIGILRNQPDGTVKTDYPTEESRVIDAVSKANPAVVSIIITKDVPTYENQNYFPFFDFGTSTQNQSNTTEKQEIGGGSGFFISSDGYIVTNTHVIDDETADYTAMTTDGKKFDAKVIAKDSTLDVAILKINGSNFHYLTFADSDNLVLGQTVIAIGNALAEYSNSISMGIISGLSRSITASDSAGNTEQLDGVIQTDAGINSGNSGGPLLDIKGNVIGVNVAMETSAENISFALPSNLVKSVVDSVKKYGKIVRPYLGVRYQQITDTIKEKNNLSVDYGVIVLRGSASGDLAVIPNSPADKAGIVENDIILEIDGVKLDDSHSLAQIVRQKQIGQTIKVKIMHDGKEKTLDIKLEEAPSN